MHAAELPSKRSLLYCVPLWICWWGFFVLPYSMQWMESGVKVEVPSNMEQMVPVAFAFTFIPLANGIDAIQTWLARALFVPLVFGLFSLLVLFPFGAMILRSIYR